TIVPLKVLENVIAEGRPGTLIPPFLKTDGGPLTPEQVLLMVFEIKGLGYRLVDKADGTGKSVEADFGDPNFKPAWARPEAPAQLVPSYKVPADAKAGDWQAGKKVFQSACAGCHGQDGLGGSKGAVNDPVFLSLISPQALRRLII